MILLIVIAYIGGVAFFFACKCIYEGRVFELKQKAKETFFEALKNVRDNMENVCLHMV